MKRFSLHALIVALIIGLLGSLAEPAYAKKRSSGKARTEQTSKSKKSSKKGSKKSKKSSKSKSSKKSRKSSRRSSRSYNRRDARSVSSRRSKFSRRQRGRSTGGSTHRISRASISRGSYRRPSTPRRPVIIRGTDTILAEPDKYISFDRPVDITHGLEGRNIALWPSHGLYFNTSSNSWAYQRPKLFTTREDLLSHTFTTAYLAPMLENAGAYVTMPRERDWHHTEIIADFDGMDAGEYAVSNGKEEWEELEDSTGYAWSARALRPTDNPFIAGTADVCKCVLPDDEDEASTAAWNAELPERGKYAVYVSYTSLPNSATDAHYTINFLDGSREVYVNQQMGGGTWVYLGSYEFQKGLQAEPIVELDNVSDEEGAVVSADAVKIGGGMGSVSRSTYSTDFTSGVPKFNEGSAIYLQTAGFPRYVWDPPTGDSYQDDYMSRAHWANYLSGSSQLFPDTIGMGVPIDLAFAFHTDAGVRHDGSTVGTLGLYSTDDGNPFGNGSARSANHELVTDVYNSVLNDVRSQYDPDWNGRSYLDRRYYEVRETKMPAMILEALSHQNFEDMRRGHDPEFKFLLSRAVYKGILKFLTHRYGLPYQVQPLPVKDLEISYKGPGEYVISWQPTQDPTEKSARPTYYLIEERINDGGFDEVALTHATSITMKVKDNDIHSYRVIAGNGGGVSFPSEVLALYNHKNEAPEAIIVNGFTRTSGPGIDKSGKGFDIERSPAVADGWEIGTTGAQYNFTEYDSSWGNSYSNLEDKVFAGNFRDYVVDHGMALRNAGIGFISSSQSAYCQGKESAKDPKLVDLILGLQKHDYRPGSNTMRFEVFPDELRARLTAHSRRGGSLLASGSYIGSEILKGPNDSTAVENDKTAFARDILGLTASVDESCIGDKVQMIPGKIPGFDRGTFEFQSQPDEHFYGVTAPDALYPVNEDDVVMRYHDCGEPAAVASQITPSNGGAVSRSLVLGFPIEAVRNEAQRESIIRAALKYLLPSEY